MAYWSVDDQSVVVSCTFISVFFGLTWAFAAIVVVVVVANLEVRTSCLIWHTIKLMWTWTNEKWHPLTTHSKSMEKVPKKMHKRETLGATNNDRDSQNWRAGDAGVHPRLQYHTVVRKPKSRTFYFLLELTFFNEVMSIKCKFWYILVYFFSTTL